MITDSGAVKLVAAIYRQAQVDVEAICARVVKLRRACEGGRLSRLVATVGEPLATEEEQTALWWYTGHRRLPKELAAMVAMIGEYRRHCRHCCRQAGRAEDGKVVQRRGVGGYSEEISAAESPGGG